MIPSLINQPYTAKSCLTVKELKALLANLPDVKGNGEDAEVWVETGLYMSSPVTSVWSLNVRGDGCDVMLCHRKEGNESDSTNGE